MNACASASACWSRESEPSLNLTQNTRHSFARFDSVPAAEEEQSEAGTQRPTIEQQIQAWRCVM